MDKHQIIAEIEAYIASRGPPGSSWVVGVTDDPDRRRDEHRREGHSTSRWRHWPADTEDDARAAERYFSNGGTQGNPGGPGNASYVYAF